MAEYLPSEEKAEGNISMKIYWKYFTAGGSYLVLLVVMVVFILGEV